MDSHAHHSPFEKCQAVRPTDAIAYS